MPSHALTLDPVDPIELTLSPGGLRAPDSGLLLTPVNRITVELDWEGAGLKLSAGQSDLALEILPYIAPGGVGGSGNGWFPGGW